MRTLALLAAAFLLPAAAQAEDVTVMISGGFMSSLKDLAPGFEKASGDHVVVVPGPSMGTTANAIPQRLARGEPDDVLIMVGYALDGFQQVAELLPVPGITFAGRLPAEVQDVTVYSAGLAKGAKDEAGGRALIQYLASPAAAPIIEKNGLQPPAK